MALIRIYLPIGAAGAPAAAPFFQNDQPNPRELAQRGEITVAQNLLLTTLAVAVVAAPFAQNDWPNPVRAKPQTRIEQAQNLRPLQSGPQVVPFNQDDWRNPAARRGQQPEAQPNLFGTVLAPSVAAPFSQSDWPNPRERRVVQLEQAQNLLALNPSKGVAFSQSDWPNPQLPERAHQEFPGTQLPQSAKPWLQSEWPVPRGKPPLLQDFLSASVHAALAGPEVQSEWLNPQTPRRAVSLNDAAGTILPQAAQPFEQGEWPNPQVARRAQQLEPLNLLGTTLAPTEARPFTQSEWIVPESLPPAWQWSAPNLTMGTLYAFPTLPFAQGEWPVPQAPEKAQQPGPHQPLLETTLAAQPRPFVQAEWLTPRGLRRAYQDVAGTRLPQTAKPHHQSDWPNPQPAERAIALQDAAGTALPRTAMPFSASSWPNPGVRIAEAPPEQLGSFLALRSVGGAPFNQADWVSQPRLAPGVWVYDQQSAFLTLQPVPIPEKQPTGRKHRPGYGYKPLTEKEVRDLDKRWLGRVEPPTPEPVPVAEAQEQVVVVAVFSIEAFAGTSTKASASHAISSTVYADGKTITMPAATVSTAVRGEFRGDTESVAVCRQAESATLVMLGTTESEMTSSEPEAVNEAEALEAIRITKLI